MDSPLAKINTSDKEAKYFDLRDEPSWEIKEHKTPEGEMLLRVFGKTLFEAANFKVNPSKIFYLKSNT